MYGKDIKLSLVNLTVTEPHIHSGLQCIFMLRGTASIEIGEKTLKLGAEDLVVINSNQLHRTVAETSNVALVLDAERDYIRNECGEFASGVIKCHCIGHSDLSSNYYGLKRAITRMLYISVKKEHGYQVDFKVELLRFLYILFTCFKTEDAAAEDAGAKKRTKNIDEILNYIDDNYYRHINLEEVAGKAFMSPQYFSKYFKRKTGYGFLEYLNSVRLKHALASIVHTDDSIIKIAMDYGFSNAKAFNTAFKKEYNETPGNFRKLYQRDGSKCASETDEVEINLEVDVELKEFMRFVKKYDINFEQVNYSKKSYEVVLRDKKIRDIAAQENILNIGKVETAGYTNLENQLETLRDNLGFKYVYFELEYHFVPNNIHYSLILYNQFFRTVDYIKKMGMLPFIKIRPSEKYSEDNLDEVREDAKNKVHDFLACINEVYSREFLRNWRIEIYPDGHIDTRIFEIFYEVTYREIKKVVPNMRVGVYALDEAEEAEKEKFSFFLHTMHNNKCLPDFTSFGVYPIHKKDEYMSNQFFYSALMGYHQEVIDTVKGAYKRSACDLPDLYMTEWNTLMGDLENESILYFRSAIIIDTLLRINKEIKGAGYWADSSVSTLYSGEPPMTSLALYMLDDVRRPIYPVLEILKRFGSDVIYEDKNIMVSKNANREYNVLIWNPRYLNPSYSLDESTTESLTRNINIKIKNLEPGAYQIKKITCNKEHAGAITQIVNAGYPDFTDMEVFDYIKYNVANGLNVYDENISSNTYVLNTNLLYNSIILYIIRKKSE